MTKQKKVTLSLGESIITNFSIATVDLELLIQYVLPYPMNLEYVQWQANMYELGDHDIQSLF
jgi:hypothetical protein